MTRSLGFRLAFLLAMALLPLGVLSAIQGRSLQRELSARAEAAVLGRTRSAAIGEQRALEQATGAARALAVAARPLAEAAPAAQGALAGPCNAMARAIVEQSALFSFAGVYDLEGGMLCRSQAPRPGWTFPRELRPGLTSPTPVAGVLEQAEFTGRPVLYAQVPVLDQGGRPIAQAAVSVPHDLAVALDDKAAGGPGLELITFEADGTILTGSAEAADHAALLPADRSLAALASDHALSFTALSASGPPRVYAVVPLVPGQVYAMGSWPADQPGGSDLAAWMPPVVLPVLMWLVSLAVALLAAERLVTRHVRRLTATIARFARGERVVPALDTHDAPWEIAALADAFTKMVAAIIRDEEARDESLRQKEVLLREVHHRVKNNLQLITSIMNLQIRRARSGEARLLLRRVQERVMSLATVHRNLYQASSLASLRAEQLLDDILRQVMNMGADFERRFQMRRQIDPVVLTPDQAVPLALWFTEVLTNAMKYASGDGPAEAARLEVTLRMEAENRCRLTVRNSVAADTGAEDSAAAAEDEADRPDGGLGSRLLEAFAEQLGGEFVMEERDGWHRAELRFTVAEPGQEPDCDAPGGAAAPPEGEAAEPQPPSGVA